MEIKVTREQGRVPVTILNLRGEMDPVSAAELEKCAQELMAAGASHLLISLAGIPNLGWVGIVAIDRILLHLLDQQPSEEWAAVGPGIRAGTFKSPHLKLVNPSPLAFEALHRAGTDMYLETFDDRKQAVASFGAHPGRSGLTVAPSHAENDLRHRLRPLLSHLGMYY